MDRDALRKQLVIDEGVVLHSYKDTLGNFTVGCGHLLPNGPIPDITYAQAMEWLDADIDEAYAELIRVLPWVQQLDTCRQNVLTNMCFNLGIHKLQQFRSMLAYLQGAHYGQAATEALNSLWAKQVGARATRLAHEMATGILGGA